MRFFALCWFGQNMLTYVGFISFLNKKLVEIFFSPHPLIGKHTPLPVFPPYTFIILNMHGHLCATSSSFSSAVIFFHYHTIRYTVDSVVEPEPDFLAGAGAGEKAPAPGCCCLA